MKKILPLSALALMAFMGCKKDGDTGTKPILTFKSASSTDIPKEQEEFTMTFNVKDGDGDLEGTWNVVELYHFDDHDKYDQLDLPKLEAHAGVKLDAEMILILSDVREGNFLKVRTWSRDPLSDPDTIQLKVFVLDKKGNSSDTILTPKIVVRR
ncbi:hypothetical protein WJU16_06025 [Chitinophaga pollutisoli]|uniref:DUF4625 domain-containing protein n=1 Tax=Chitinophaga pollutisoli TaxID=3133966 RepID=A0ABZ2YTK9_9BACT